MRMVAVGAVQEVLPGILLRHVPAATRLSWLQPPWRTGGPTTHVLKSTKVCSLWTEQWTGITELDCRLSSLFTERAAGRDQDSQSSSSDTGSVRSCLPSCGEAATEPGVSANLRLKSRMK